MAVTTTSEPLIIDPESVANASAFNTDGDTNSYATSLASSIRDYHYENGRRYHAFREGKWLVPNDDEEQDRMDLLHHWNRMLLGGKLLHFEAEVLKAIGGPSNDLQGKRVLDVGTGTGIWAIEAADTFPEATVIGTDLSPIQPRWVPPNLSFIVEDAESPWVNTQPFDLIHGRNLSGAFAQWSSFYKQCFDNLVPGGVLEMQDFDFRLYHARDGEEGVPRAIRDWSDVMNDASKKMGRPLDVSHLHVEWMKECGFEEVQEVVREAPLGDWPKDPRMKQIGLYHIVESMDGIAPYTQAIWTRVLGRTQEDAMLVVGQVKKEIANTKNLLLSKHRYIYGRKPAS